MPRLTTVIERFVRQVPVDVQALDGTATHPTGFKDRGHQVKLRTRIGTQVSPIEIGRKLGNPT